MNSLSWMLYASDVVDSLKGVGILSSIGVVITIAARHIFAVVEMNPTPKQKKLWVLLVALLFMTVLAPDKKTILLIAASEAASTVATSTTGKEILDDTVEVIRGWLKEQKKAK